MWKGALWGIMTTTRADDKLVGYEYQFYYFLLTLLRMRNEEIVGFEVREDVHKEGDNYLELYQLKHTIQTDVQGNIKNLTTSDTDLWKTLSLWVDIIKKERKQEEFLNITRLVFVSNKLDNDSNKFLEKFKKFKVDNNFVSLKAYLNSYLKELELKYKYKVEEYEAEFELKRNNIKKPTKNINIKYIKNIKSIDDKILSLFFNRLKFDLGLDDIISKIKDNLQVEKYIIESRVDSIFNLLCGLLKEDFYNKVKRREVIEYSAVEFANITLPIFKRIRSEKPNFTTDINYKKSIKIIERTFAKQLKDIGVEDDEIYNLDYKRNLAINNLKRLEQENEISVSDIEELDKNTIDNWIFLYKKQYLREENRDNINAQDLLYTLLDKDLDLTGYKISMKGISSGQFVKISDIPEIGWKYDWAKEYKKDEL